MCVCVYVCAYMRVYFNKINRLMKSFLQKKNHLSIMIIFQK